MKLAAIILAAITLSACSRDTGLATPVVPNTPAQPSSPIPSSAYTFLWGYVVNTSGVCIEGAKVRVVAGQRSGESITQTTPCDAWGYWDGFRFDRLTPGVSMTLRVSAPGYAEIDETVTPSLGPQTAVIIAPPRQPPPTHD